MISYEEVSHLLGLAAARDQRTVGRADIAAWHADLNAASVSIDDATQALNAFYQEMASRRPEDRFRATPVDLIDIAKRARRERVANLRYDGDPDETPQQYLANLRARTKALADGNITADTGLRALGPGTPDPRLARQLAAVGTDIRNMSTDEATTTRRPTRVGPLTITCPTCQAPLGKHCRSNGRNRTVPHAARRRAARDAAGQPREDDEQIAARKAASAAALARLTPEQRQQLDDMNQ
ncbi:hypothetical protein K378_01386 [Streptomyces sp. Amel2xB2]|uniref:zinc finger domain-containing protein n=1 Tax=Streptomyces sp. Amel2xB2 TaxID=1305829 RepID=UPI000DB98818|nr:hypothetical protein [Streptomyces sp. Amel2xB2]RAJ70221.1 hypothetical protein K378_01386 [Streptomyces sp. Amel2xB2]